MSSPVGEDYRTHIIETAEWQCQFDERVLRQRPNAGRRFGGLLHDQLNYPLWEADDPLFRPGESHNLHARVHEKNIARNSTA